MKDTQFEIDTAAADAQHSDTYLAAVAAMDAAAKRKEQQSYGWMVIASAAAGGYPDDGKEPRVVAYARMFCLLFAMAAPNILLMRMLF